MRFPTPSMAVSLTALLVALGGAAVSATGGNFILGTINSASNQSGIVSPVNGKMLLLNNTSTAANATALGLTVKPGHPPMVVNSDVRVPQLNSDKLDDFDSSEFGRVLQLRGPEVLSAITLVAGNNFQLGPGITFDADGRCQVAISSQIFSGSSTADRGPFYRGAIARAGSSPEDDGFFGHYFYPIFGIGLFVSPDMTRVSVYEVSAGETVQFGAFFGGVPASWAGRSAETNVSYFCTTVGTDAGPLPKIAAKTKQ